MFLHTPILLDPERYSRLPMPLARAAHTLRVETETNGVHTTADELSGCIEALYGLLGRVWLAEYLAAGAGDDGINRRLHQIVTTGGRVLGGGWVSLARQVRDVFLREGWEPVAQGLLVYDFGGFGQPEHPVAKLLEYRNSFAHGSFQSVQRDIEAHRDLLDVELGTLPFLWEQPFLLNTDAGVFELRQQRVPGSVPAGIDPEHRMRPVLLAKDGRVLDLYPLMVGSAGGDLGLFWPGKSDLGVKGLIQQLQFAAWSLRYQRELEGHVIGANECLGSPGAWPEAQAALHAALDGRTRGIVLVETAPGAPRSGVLAAWAASDKTRTTVHWKVLPGELMGSGLVFARSLLRATERALGLADGTLACATADAWRAALVQASTLLEQSGKVLGIAVEDLHLGDTGRPGEPTVQDVWRAIAVGPFLAVAGTVRNWALRTLPYDARVALGWDHDTDFATLRAFLTRRGSGDLHEATLAVLIQADAPLDLFEVCDAIEARPARHANALGAQGGTAVFEPAVERALWDLAPLLTLGRERRSVGGQDGTQESVRTFAPLDLSILCTAVEQRA
jgi:hypothetical protein